MGAKHNLAAHLERPPPRLAPAPALGVKKSGSWRWIAYRELSERVRRLRGALAKRGIGRGDRVAAVGDNSVELAALAYACWGSGAAFVPVVTAQRLEQQRAIVAAARPALVVCGSAASHRQHEGAAAPRVGVELEHGHPDGWAAFTAGAHQSPELCDVDPDEPATILFTPGTGGEPKGVVLSHRNIAANVDGLLAALPIASHDRTLSFLPWGHAFGHTAELVALLRAGASLALNDAPEHLLSNLREVEPTVLVTVPLVLGWMFDRVQVELKRRPAVFRALFEKGRELKRLAGERSLRLGERLGLEAAERVAFAQLRSLFGGKLRFAVSGGAPLSAEVAELVEHLGIPVYQGYGLTEATAVVSVNTPAARRRGSVGRPIPGVRIAIEPGETTDGVGEVVVYGESVMQGYLDDEAGSRAVITPDGGLRTGDLGRLDEAGFLYLRGRMDERYKLASGHDVLPAPIESRIKLSPFVANVMVYGEGREHNVALVVVDVDAVSRWAQERDLHFHDTGDMLASERVRQMVMAEIGERSEAREPHERIRAAALIDQDFTAKNGLATATGEIRRAAILARWRDRIEALYAR